MDFTFTLKFRLSQGRGRADNLYVARILEAAGARNPRQHPGQLALVFTRTGSDARSVMRQTIADVRVAMPMAMLAEVAPDYIGLTGLAELFGLSRQSLRKLMVTHEGRFPSPVHEVHGAVWHLAEMLEWLDAMRIYRIDVQLLEVARAAAQVNLALQLHRLRELRRDTARLIELPREIAVLMRAAGLPV